MRRGVRRSLMVALVGFGLWLAPAPAWALPDDLPSLLVELLKDGCLRLSPLSSSSLSNVCAATAGIPGDSGSSAATASTQAAAAEAALQARMKQRRKAGDASEYGLLGDSADGLGGRLGVFASYEFERYDKDVTRFESGYTTDQHGGTAGIDFRFDTWLIGGAFTVSQQEGRYDRDGGNFFVETGGGTIYASFFPIPNLFFDVTASYMHKDYDFNRHAEMLEGAVVVVQGNHRGITTGNEYRITVNGGYDFTFGSAVVGPRLGFNWQHNTMKRYVENDADPANGFAGNLTGLELRYDGQEWDSATLNVGIYGSYAFSTPIGVLVPQGTATYVHEFLRDQRVIYFSFAGDSPQNRFRFKTDRPDRDYVIVSVGLLWQAANGITPFVNYRALAGYRDHSSHTVTGGVRFSF